MLRRFDDLMIGGHMSGLPLAARTTQHGTTAFIEHDLLGGPCLYRGCIATWTMIASAKLAGQVCRAARTIHVHPTRTESGNAAGVVHPPLPHTHRGPDG
jgi:pyruvate/2-oxoglutarate dehydrogenase complex dihydrolipoamide dehydrogenase (E3) component